MLAKLWSDDVTYRSYIYQFYHKEEIVVFPQKIVNMLDFQSCWFYLTKTLLENANTNIFKLYIGR